MKYILEEQKNINILKELEGRPYFDSLMELLIVIQYDDEHAEDFPFTQEDFDNIVEGCEGKYQRQLNGIPEEELIPFY